MVIRATNMSSDAGEKHDELEEQPAEPSEQPESKIGQIASLTFLSN